MFIQGGVGLLCDLRCCDVEVIEDELEEMEEVLEEVLETPAWQAPRSTGPLTVQVHTYPCFVQHCGSCLGGGTRCLYVPVGYL